MRDDARIVQMEIGVIEITGFKYMLLGRAENGAIKLRLQIREQCVGVGCLREGEGIDGAKDEG